MPNPNNRELIRSIRAFYSKIKGMESCLESRFLPISKEETKKFSQLKNKIISEVEKEYNIPFRKLISSKQSEAVKAKATLIIIFNKHLFMSQKEIANQLHITQPLVSERIAAFEKMSDKRGSLKQISNNKFYTENGFFDSHKKIDKIVGTYKLSLWQRKN